MNKKEIYICIYDGDERYVGTGPTPTDAHLEVQSQAFAPLSVSECIFYKGCEIKVVVKLEEVIVEKNRD